MFTHVMVGANDLAASKKFYDAVLGAIGLGRMFEAHSQITHRYC